MNQKNTISHIRKSSLSELKSVLHEVIQIQYEKKVKKLQKSRKSRSPSLKKQKTHSKSKSTISNCSRNLNSRLDGSSANIEKGSKSPEFYYREEDLKNLRAENSDLKQKLSSIKKDYDLLIVEIRSQLEQEKEFQINKLTNLYIEKITSCEKKLESQLKEQLSFECIKIKEEAKKNYEKNLKALMEDKDKGQLIIEKMMKTDLNQDGNTMSGSFDLEHRFKLILESKISEFERKLQISSQELSKFRRENDSLKSKIVELQAKIETSVHSSSDVSPGLVSKYNDTVQECNMLKKELEKKQDNICVKCRAVIQANSELSRKILRIREFISN